MLFAVEPAREAEIRTRIDRALATGFCEAPDGTQTRWVLRSSAPGTATEVERGHAHRLVTS